MTSRSKITSVLEKDLATVLNRHSQEYASDTPDFILAEYMLACLNAWNKSVRTRERWFGRGKREVFKTAPPKKR